MNKKILFAALCLCASAAGSLGQGITNGTATPPGNFFPTNTPAQPFINVLGNWVTSYNTSLAWTNSFQIDTGVATTTGSGVEDRLNIRDNFGNFEAGLSGQFLGAGSAFSQIEAVGGYALVNKYDFKLCVEIGAGYDFAKADKFGKKLGAIVVEPGLAAYKLITANTYATVGYSFPVESVGKFNGVGTFYAGAGFTF